jgi:hypothetical protein
VAIVKGQVAGQVVPLSWTVPAPATFTWPFPLVASCLSISQFDNVTQPLDPNPIVLPLLMLLFRSERVAALDIGQASVVAGVATSVVHRKQTNNRL